ncbi:MAG: autotransporter assembly complex family protein [Methylobacter sp.]|nr:autotransporter assembly complex family protein [Methylobacter sp.]
MLLPLITTTVFADVSVSGLDSETQDNVQLMLSLSKEKCEAPTWKIRSLFAKADGEIDQALRALGYYHPVFEKTLTFKQDCWQAHFTVNLGPRVTVTDITITLSGDARNDPEFEKLRATLLAEKGKPLSHDNYEKIKSRIESLALERGYLNSRFGTRQLLIDKANNSAHFKLAFDGGKRKRFGEVTVEQDILQPEFVAKLIAIKSDDFYASAQLAETHNTLSRSGYFGRVDIRPDTENSGQRVPVTINLSPQKKHHYSLGAGFDTDIGPLLSASYKNRYINRRGHFLNANIDLAPVLSIADVEYSVPLANPVSDFFSVGGGFKREETDTINSLSAKLSARLKHVFDSGWRQTLFLDSVYEDFTVGNDSNQVLLLVPGGSWLRSVADSTLRPTRGHRLEFNLAGSYKNPLSDVSFAQGSAAAVWMQPLPWSGNFTGRIEQGVTLVDQFDLLPTSYRFYGGGMNSIRGYGYKELGPKDNLGNVVGGKFLSVVSAEYEQPVLENWSVAAFIDSGNAYNFDNINVKSGAGLGLRWYSPIGPVRLDLALPLNDADSSFQIHFAAGARL